jgi:hypothetical protein
MLYNQFTNVLQFSDNCTWPENVEIFDNKISKFSVIAFSLGTAADTAYIRPYQPLTVTGIDNASKNRANQEIAQLRTFLENARYSSQTRGLLYRLEVIIVHVIYHIPSTDILPQQKVP